MFFGRKKNKRENTRRGPQQSNAATIVDRSQLPPYEMVRDIARVLKRKLIIAGACWGPEAHRVVLDPLLTMKGYLGDPGLEAYAEFSVVSLKASENLEEVIKLCCDSKADVVLLSHLGSAPEVVSKELKQFVHSLNDLCGPHHKMIKICVHPRISHDEAKELGFEAGFGAGTMPREVIRVIDR